MLRSLLASERSGVVKTFRCRTSANPLDYLYLNQVAQNVVTLGDATREFRDLDSDARSDVMHRLYLMTHQSHPLPDEVPVAITQSGLKPTFTPCVMLSDGNIESQLSRIAKLPDNELDKAFLLVLALFRIADNRRRQFCGNNCHHWWHQDLSDDAVVREVTRNGEA